jgi:hypothetical protein
VLAFGGAGFNGSMGGKAMNAPVVGMAATPDGQGYWLVASDGGIFSFGDAPFYGSASGACSSTTAIGMSVDPFTGGYWILTAARGVYNYRAQRPSGIRHHGALPRWSTRGRMTSR